MQFPNIMLPLSSAIQNYNNYDKIYTCLCNNVSLYNMCNVELVHLATVGQGFHCPVHPYILQTQPQLFCLVHFGNLSESVQTWIVFHKLRVAKCLLPFSQNCYLIKILSGTTLAYSQ